jgi:hypothetical protein
LTTSSNPSVVSEAKEAMILSEKVAQIEAKLNNIPELPKRKEVEISEESPVQVKGIEPESIPSL